VSRLPQDIWQRATVSAVMTPRERLAVAAADDAAISALRKFAERDVEQLPVVDASDHLVGMLTRSAIARWLELHVGATTRLGAPHPA